MKAKLDYWVTVQEVRAVRCAKLQESEAAYTEALREMAAKKSCECTSLCQEPAECMQDLEAQAYGLKIEVARFPPNASDASSSSPQFC